MCATSRNTTVDVSHASQHFVRLGRSIHCLRPSHDSRTHQFVHRHELHDVQQRYGLRKRHRMHLEHRCPDVSRNWRPKQYAGQHDVELHLLRERDKLQQRDGMHLELDVSDLQRERHSTEVNGDLRRVRQPLDVLGGRAVHVERGHGQLRAELRLRPRRIDVRGEPDVHVDSG